MAGGDYSRKRIIFQDVSMNKVFAATDGNLTLITGVTGYTLYIQRINVFITTSAAQAITFESSSGTPIIMVVPSSPTVNTNYTTDFGPEGIALADGDGLKQAMTAGNAGNVTVEAFLKPDAVTTVTGPTVDVGSVVHTFANAYPTDN